MTIKSLIILGILLSISLSLVMTMPLYADPDREDNCLDCHTKGNVALSSPNATALRVSSSSSFSIIINAAGEASGLTIKWPSTINALFTFTPSQVRDNGPSDRDVADNQVEGHFSFKAPTIQGEYSAMVFAVDSAEEGDVLAFQVTVVVAGPTLGNLPPNPYFLHTRRGMTIEFEDRSWDSDGNITSWLWDFGDNGSSTEQNPTHTFAEPGTYTVTLTVTDNDESSYIKSKIFKVPSKEELFQLWGVQVFVGSLIAIFTVTFVVGIVARPAKRKARSEQDDRSSTQNMLVYTSKFFVGGT